MSNFYDYVINMKQLLKFKDNKMPIAHRDCHWLSPDKSWILHMR